MKAKVGNSFGFSLLEVVMAIIVLVVGLLSLLTLFSQSIVSMYLVQEDLIAGQKAREAVESIYTARDTQQVTFDMIQNIPERHFPGRISGPEAAQFRGDCWARPTAVPWRRFISRVQMASSVLPMIRCGLSPISSAASKSFPFWIYRVRPIPIFGRLR